MEWITSIDVLACDAPPIHLVFLGHVPISSLDCSRWASERRFAPLNPFHPSRHVLCVTIIAIVCWGQMTASWRQDHVLRNESVAKCVSARMDGQRTDEWMATVICIDRTNRSSQFGGLN